MLKRLCQTIRAAGKRLEVLETSDGTRMLMFPYGARVLGLFSAQSEDSFFWNNPRLEQNATARSLLTSDGWHNTGGDRTWIAPEWDTFFPDANSNAYLQPRELDMSDYDMQATCGGTQFSRQMTLHLARSNRDVALRLTKWFGAAANPLRHERRMASELEGGGIRRIYAAGDAAIARRACRTAGGRRHLEPAPASARRRDARAALQPHDAAEVFRRDSGGDRMTIEGHLLRVKVDFSGSHKIALKAAVDLRPCRLRLRPRRSLLAGRSQLLRQPVGRIHRRAAARSRRLRLRLSDVPRR